ncbi:MAG: response regulator, partial [Acidobacteriota bacterium]|nr:response regulator [Acidobacteriota bacterium]
MSHTLLLVDDSVAIHRVIELTFAGQPIDVVAMDDGAAALAQIEARPPDIVLADIVMPGLDGYELCRRIKGTPRLAHIPVVLLAGAFEEIDEARARAAGYDAVLAKPFEPQLVVRRVQELLARRPAVETLAPPPPQPPAPVRPPEPAAPVPPPQAPVATAPDRPMTA